MPKVSEPLTLAPEEINAKANLNGVNGDSIPKHSTTTPTTHRYDPNFTQNVINSMGPKTAPRMRKIMASLIQHVHDFARENEVTLDEWMAGVDFVRYSVTQMTTNANLPIDQCSRPDVRRQTQRNSTRL